MGHTDELAHALAKVSDPTSPEYGHYLSKAQVDAMTAPTQHDINLVKHAMQGTAIEVRAGGSQISAIVTVAFAERLLGGNFVYTCPIGWQSANDRSACLIRNPTATVPSAL